MRTIFARTIFAFLTLLVPVVNGSADSSPPFVLPPRSELLKLRSAAIFTNKGALLLELYPEDAPWHVANLKYLADKGFYNGLRFHFHHPGYIIQGGAPTSNPNSGPGYTLPPEFNTHRHEKGTVGMARWPDQVNSERLSNGSQFHILLTTAPAMNSAYTIFGKVVRGLDVLEDLRVGDTISSIKVFVREDGASN